MPKTLSIRDMLLEALAAYEALPEAVMDAYRASGMGGLAEENLPAVEAAAKRLMRSAGRLESISKRLDAEATSTLAVLEEWRLKYRDERADEDAAP